MLCFINEFCKFVLNKTINEHCKVNILCMRLKTNRLGNHFGLGHPTSKLLKYGKYNKQGKLLNKVNY